MNKRKANPSMTIAAVVAVLFGVTTIWSGGQALFGEPETRAVFGDVVPFVLWFNFFAGFAYVVAGFGLFLKRTWAAWLAALIASATPIAFAAFGIHILNDGAYEVRTVGAMTLRSLVWIGIAVIAVRTRLDRTA